MASANGRSAAPGWRLAFALATAALVLGLRAIPSSEAASVNQPDCRGSAITSPRPGDLISGTLRILGSARIDRFQFYKLEWAPAAAPEDWRATSNVIERPVSNGLLDQWSLASIPDGAYRLKLTVVDQDFGEACQFLVEPLLVAQEATPEPSPSPSLIPGPTAIPRARPTQESDVAADASESDREDASSGDSDAEESAAEDEASSVDATEEDQEDAEPAIAVAADNAAPEQDPLSAMWGSFSLAFVATLVLLAVLAFALLARSRSASG